MSETIENVSEILACVCGAYANHRHHGDRCCGGMMCCPYANR